jgi:hypothetical protein
MGKLKITEQDIRLCQTRGMSILAIAEEYGVTAYYVLRKVQQMESREQREKYQGDENGLLGGSLFKRDALAFDLKVGDTITAIEAEITQARKRYRVTEIYGHIYIGERLSGGARGQGTWKTAFQKKDYRRAHDPNLVKLVSRGGIEV